MKFYLETASGDTKQKVDVLSCWFKIETANFKQKPNPSAQEETVIAFTVEIDSLEELLKLVDSSGGSIVIDWQHRYPPAEPRQHIPVLRIVDDYL